MLNLKQIDFYNLNGYLSIDNVYSDSQIKLLSDITNEFVEKSRLITEENDMFSFESDHSANNPRLTRIKSPHKLHTIYEQAMRDEKMLDIIEHFIGKNIRFQGAKLNMKMPRGGRQVEWHTDWGHHPHTNDDMLAVGIALDDITEENGCLMVIPGSHKWDAISHHEDGFFVGAVDPSNSHYNLDLAEPIIAKAGSISIHHVRCLHGSRKNNSEKSRRVLFAGYCAADSWPLRGILDSGIKPNSSEGDYLGNVYEAFKERMIVGEPSLVARVEKNPVRMPYPPAKSVGSIYENQKEVLGRSFGE